MILGERNRAKRSAEKGIEWALWLYGFMALWLYGFIWTLKIYFYCIETSINATFPVDEKSPYKEIFCNEKLCQAKLYLRKCEWKFIVRRATPKAEWW